MVVTLSITHLDFNCLSAKKERYVMAVSSYNKDSSNQETRKASLRKETLKENMNDNQEVSSQNPFSSLSTRLPTAVNIMYMPIYPKGTYPALPLLKIPDPRVHLDGREASRIYMSKAELSVPATPPPHLLFLQYFPLL